MIYLQDKKINKFGNNKIYLKDKLVYQYFFKPTILNGVITSYVTTTSENKNVLITGKKEYFDSITLEDGTEILSTGTGDLNYTFAEQGTYKILYKLKNNITKLSSIFYFCSELNNIDLNNIDASNIISMSSMFRNCSSLTTLNLSNFKTKKNTNMSYLFAACPKLSSVDLSSFDTSNVTNMSYMFNTCSNLAEVNLSSFNTSNVTDMRYMFTGCSKLSSLDLSGFDASKVTEMRFMFYNCSKLNHIKCKQEFKDWCILNQDTINLPTALREGGNGTWEIV